MDSFEKQLRDRLRRAADELQGSVTTGSLPNRAPTHRRRAMAVGARLAVLAAVGILILQVLPQGQQVPTLGLGEPNVQDANSSGRPARVDAGNQSATGSPTGSPTSAPTVESSPPNPAPVRCKDPEPPVTPPSEVRVTLELSQTMFDKGEEVIMNLRLRNAGLTPVRYWHGGKEYDVWVEGPTGRVWVWSQWMGQHGNAFQLYLRQDVLAPGEERKASVTWDQSTCSVPDGPDTSLIPGRYTARALWVAEDPNKSSSESWWSDPVQFEVR